MKREAVCVLDGYLSPTQCEAILAGIRAYRRDHELPLIDRAERGRSLRYRVIDGRAVADALSDLEELSRRTAEVISTWAGRPLSPVANRLARINVNITPPGGEYRWHYDRNDVTAILYLNEVEGGATEIYANHRIVLPQRLQSLQWWLDAIARARIVRRLLGSKAVVEPRPGRLVIMRGSRCLHSVCPVQGTHERINLCMAYEHLGARVLPRDTLDAYLYTDHVVDGGDPNYRR